MTPPSCMVAADSDREQSQSPWSEDGCFWENDETPEAPALYINENKLEDFPFSRKKPTKRERALFSSLVDTWRKETSHISRADRIITHPAYRSIIEMGEPAVPLILSELERYPDYWFWALREITHSDPISPAIMGDVKAMASAWIGWGKANEYEW